MKKGYKFMMSLRAKQHRFVKMVAKLILWAYDQGYTLTFGDAYRDSRCGYGHPMSLHRDRLAIDLNLFKDGRYLKKTEDHRPIGEHWEAMGGSWGGRFNDGNHYSLAHNGRK